MLVPNPERRQYELTVKAYADRRKPNKCLKDYDHIPFAAEYSDSDADIADKFVALFGCLHERPANQWPTFGAQAGDASRSAT
jgi:hypothetical protein